MTAHVESSGEQRIRRLMVSEFITLDGVAHVGASVAHRRSRRRPAALAGEPTGRRPNRVLRLSRGQPGTPTSGPSGPGSARRRAAGRGHRLRRLGRRTGASPTPPGGEMLWPASSRLVTGCELRYRRCGRDRLPRRGGGKAGNPRRPGGGRVLPQDRGTARPDARHPQGRPWFRGNPAQCYSAGSTLPSVV